MKRHQILLLHIATSILALFPFPIHAHKMMYQDSIEIVVHRGANHIAPENTIPSALAALKHGAGWIEVDVRKSKDNILYNLHDETLDRTTNGKGPIQDMLSKDIEKLDAGSWFSSRFTGIHVPRIAEMLDTLQGKAHIFFDVKRGTPIKDLITLVRQKGYENKSFFWFADSEMLKEFIKIAPEMKIKVNASNIAALEKWMKICTPAYVETDILNITPQFKEFCKSNHIKIMAAIQNASEKEYKKAIEAHPDLVNLDRPELFIKMLRQEIKK